MSVSRRTIIARLLGAAALGIAATNPLILAGTANAQGNGGGNGNGNGGGGGSGNGNGGGNGGGNGNGNGGGNNGGNGNNGNGKGGNGKGGVSASPTGSGLNATPASPTSYARVVHANGMSERVSGGRYEMRDAQGRLIVRRRATIGDVSRLRSAR